MKTQTAPVRDCMCRVVSESEFYQRIVRALDGFDFVGSVTGPGRSGAVAAVYASHLLSIPFIPFGQKPPAELGPLLIIDTAQESGKTIRKAIRKYKNYDVVSLVLYHEPPRVMFWYESPKPQRYKHENRTSTIGG